MALRKRQLSERDRQEWAHYARLLKPLPGRGLPAPEPPPPPQPPQLQPPQPAPPQARTGPDQTPPRHPRPAAPDIAVGTPPGGLDKGSWNRFRSGRLGVVRTIDLHGRTAQRAYHALHAFLVAAHADQIRCVEVITGRGSGETGGVIRRELPIWLNQPALRPLVLAAAHPHAANPGSVRLLLRRAR